MGEKRDWNDSIIKTFPIIRDLRLNPHCEHGPTILFDRNGSKYFACSAFRSRKLCQFYLPEDKWKVCSANSTEVQNKLPSTVKGNRQKNNPLSNPTQRDKGEAQYHFNERTVKFFMDHFYSLSIDSVLCIGTPSLHQEINSKEHGKLKSFLLDIDNRFENIYNEFSLYNMCNHYFFQDKTKYTEFLSMSKNLALVVDPPFGVKAEILLNGCISGVKNDLANLNSLKPEDLRVFWIFPYFMEGHINKCGDAVEFKMSDFHVEYRNHRQYQGTKTKPSPIRVFTNVHLSKISLPEVDYRYCDICMKWVDKQNQHCDLCETCTTKDGGKSYVHCYRCNKCVKSTWIHCQKCRGCHLNDLKSCEKGADISNQHKLHRQTDIKKQKGSKKMKSSFLNRKIRNQKGIKSKTKHFQGSSNK